MSDITIYDNDKLAQKDTGWIIDQDCPLILYETREHNLDEIDEMMEKLALLENASPFWWGKIANDNKERHGYGEMTRLAQKHGKKEKSFWDYAYVQRKTTSIIIEVYNEYPDLSWGHYQVVAPMKEEEQLHWLRYAGEHNLSAPKLRAAIKGDEWEARCFNHWSAMPIEEWQNPYPGQIPGGILQNIIYYTTEIGDKVIDPFGGGGNMALACKRMDRNCVTYDIDEDKPFITHNALYPFPDNGAQLVFLDPPYWKQKKGEYQPGPDDLSNIKDPDTFHNALKIVTDNAWDALEPGGYCVLIIGASQTKDYFIDHAAEMYTKMRDKWISINNVAAAYPTTQYSGNDVSNAKKNKYMLNLYTTIQFWQKPND